MSCTLDPSWVRSLPCNCVSVTRDQADRAVLGSNFLYSASPSRRVFDRLSAARMPVKFRPKIRSRCRPIDGMTNIIRVDEVGGFCNLRLCSTGLEMPVRASAPVRHYQTGRRLCHNSRPGRSLYYLVDPACPALHARPFDSTTSFHSGWVIRCFVARVTLWQRLQIRWKSACPFSSGKDWACPTPANQRKAINPKLKTPFHLDPLLTGAPTPTRPTISILAQRRAQVRCTTPSWAPGARDRRRAWRCTACHPPCR